MPFARSRFLGIRARMIGLVAVTALPLAVVAARFAIDHLEHEKANAYERVTTLARSSATRLDDEIGNVATLLLSLGHAVAIDKGYVAANDLLLRRIRRSCPTTSTGWRSSTPTATTSASRRSWNRTGRSSARRAATISRRRSAARRWPSASRSPGP